MKRAIIILFLFLPVVLSATNYYVAPTGNDNNPGTITQPFGSWQYAFNKLSAGDILYVRGGKYTIMGSSSNGVSVSSKNGTSGSLITVTAYPNETPVLDCSGLSSSSGDRNGLMINKCSYWKIQGLTIINVSEPTGGGSPGPGCQIFSSSHITMERVTVRDCDNGFTCHAGSDDIHYINCDSYQNADHIDNGDLANGFWCRVTGGGKIYYEGCRSWLNSDDGWDMFADAGQGTGGQGWIYFNNCWAFDNGYWDGMTGNGAGFKVGRSDADAINGAPQRLITNCLSFNNRTIGYDESQDQAAGMSIPTTIFNSVSYKNGEVGFNFRDDKGRSATEHVDIIRNCISYLDPYISYSWGNNIQDHNSWNGKTVTSGDFMSLDATQAKGARQSDGSLPVMTFLHLAASSGLIDAGTTVGLPFVGKTADIGTFETQAPAAAPAPVFISAVVENATPSLIEMTYSLSLANMIPASSALNVMVNSVARTISLVSVSGNKVRLTLASPLAYGDIATISYTKPAVNPLQVPTGEQANGLSAQSIVNNILTAIVPTTAKIKMTIYPNPVHKIVNLLFEYTAFSVTDAARSPQLIRVLNSSGMIFLEKIIETGVTKVRIPINLRRGSYTVSVLSGGLLMSSQKMRVY